MLSARDKSVLDFEGSWWLYPGPKDRAIKEYLGMSASRYYQVLRRLMDDSKAFEHAPLTLKRLHRMRRGRLRPVGGHVSDGDSAS